jgi:tetratricopeptide (TPR) repeat protein
MLLPFTSLLVISVMTILTLRKLGIAMIGEVEIEKETFGHNHVNVARSFMWLDDLYCKNGDLEKAKDYYERALEIRKEQLGGNHVDVAKSFNALGILCNDVGDLGKAKDYYQRALEIRKEQLGPNHVDVASYYNKLAGLYDIGELEHSGVFCCWNNICIIS